MQRLLSTPKFFRTAQGNRIGWEIYSWRSFFITLSLGSVEIQVNRWSTNKYDKEN